MLKQFPEMSTAARKLTPGDVSNRKLTLFPNGELWQQGSLAIAG